MFNWLKDKFMSIFEWIQSRIVNSGQWFQFFFSSTRSSDNLSEGNYSTPFPERGKGFPEPISDITSHNPDNNKIIKSEVDFSSYNIGDQRFQSESYAKMYEISPSRKWQWLRNLIYLKKWSHSIQNENNNTQILEQFSNREEMLVNTDLSFVRNPLPFVPGGAYINQSSFEEYLSHLASYRHYHLFAQVLFCMLKKNSISTLELLKNLIHARDQLNEQHFFDNDFTLLYVKNKSQQWITSLIYRILPKIPVNTVSLSESSVSIPERIDHKNILLCDDICYTGTQVCEMISSLVFHNKHMRITLLFARMSIYALTIVNNKIEEINASNPGFQVNIVVGELFHTMSAQLDFLPFPPTKEERHIIKQILESDFSEQYHLGDFRRKPLLTTAWKKPDYVSSYCKFLGVEKEGPNPLAISSALLTKPPRQPITLFSQTNPAPNVRVAQAFISGPTPPYKV